jgi:phage terminase large subunit-like protein
MGRPAHEEVPDPQQISRLARRTMSGLERRKKYDRLSFMDDQYWYPSQLEFFTGTDTAITKIVTGGNRSGKTLCACAEMAWHLNGRYPSWFRGKKFKGPIWAWAVGSSSEQVRWSLQVHLCGSDFGEGLIPLEDFNRPPTMKPGATGAIDTIYVNHYTDGKPDGVSSLSFKSYEQKREKLQAEAVQVILADERPPRQICSELLARTMDTNGIILISYTATGICADDIDEVVAIRNPWPWASARWSAFSNQCGGHALTPSRLRRNSALARRSSCTKARRRAPTKPTMTAKATCSCGP